MNSIVQDSFADSVQVTFDPGNKKVGLQSGMTLLTIAQKHDVKIASACGGRGICKTCVVRFVDGHVPAASSADNHFFSPAKINKGWRRACQTEPQASCTVHIPARTRAESARMQVDGSDFWIPPEPVVQSFDLSLTAPSLDDNLADAERLIAAINNVSDNPCSKIDFNVLSKLPDTLRRHNWNVEAVVRFDEVIAVRAQAQRLTGLAVDLGTTNIGIFLIDLRSGATIASTGIENPQTKFGGDVIARVGTAAKSQSSADEMHDLVVTEVNKASEELCKNHDLNAVQIVDVVFVANTAMHHLFVRLPVNGLGLAPFAPVIADAMDLKARDLGIKAATGAYLHMLPNIAGFVGGDHTAMLLGICADTEERTVIALDIGTNTEISLIYQGKVSSLSCPSGPALEGGHISCGMRAATGAIEAVSVTNGTILLRTIGDTTPLGICGSAVLDIVSALYKSGGISKRGKINDAYEYATERDGEKCFLLYEGEHDIVFTQKDIRAVQLAKGAVRAGIELLLETAGLGFEQVDKIVIAGAFGNYVRIDSAVTIGMLPELPLNRFEQVGNAAGIGAKLALLSAPLRISARLLATRSEHIVQSGNPRFNDIFMHSINFPDLKSG